MQLHAVRWFSLSAKDIGQVEDIAVQVWPRTDLQRAEILCYSRWKPGLSPDGSDSSKYQLLKQRFCMYQEAELVGLFVLPSPRPRCCFAGRVCVFSQPVDFLAFFFPSSC